MSAFTNSVKIKKLTKKLGTNIGVNNTGQKMLRFRKGHGRKRHIITDIYRVWSKQFFLICRFIKNSKKKIFALIKYANGSYCYVPAIHGMHKGYYYKTYNKPYSFISDLLPGISMYIQYVRRFYIFSNICFLNHYRAMYATAPGTYCKISHKNKELNIIVFWLPTGEKKKAKYFTLITLGRNMGVMNKFSRDSKAGDSEHKGFRSKVRGVAMNPVDHPNGGRTKTNQPEKSVWGWVAKKNS